MRNRQIVLSTAIGVMLWATSAAALDDDDVRKMGKECEAARSEALQPIRERKTQACIEQQLRSKGHCERYYSTYGNVMGAAQWRAGTGLFL